MEGLDSQTTSHILLELSAYEAGTEIQVLASFRILLGFPVYGGKENIMIIMIIRSVW